MFDQGVQNFDFDNYINGNNNTIDNNVDINMMYNGNMINVEELILLMKVYKKE